MLCSSVVCGTLFTYWYWFGDRHRRHRKDLIKQLSQASKVVKDLEEKLLSLEALDLDASSGGEGRKEIRVWMDGAFDMVTKAVTIMTLRRTASNSDIIHILSLSHTVVVTLLLT